VIPAKVVPTQTAGDKPEAAIPDLARDVEPAQSELEQAEVDPHLDVLRVGRGPLEVVLREQI